MNSVKDPGCQHECPSCGTAIHIKLKVCGDCAEAAYRAANKDKISKQMAAYRAANKDVIAKQQAAYYAANKDVIAKQQAAYHAANKDKAAAYRAANKDVIAKQQAAYRAANKDVIAKQQAAYYAANKDKIDAKHREWLKRNPNYEAKRRVMRGSQEALSDEEALES